MTKKCARCLEEKKLVKSHIVPEFVHKPVYSTKGNEKGKAKRVTFAGDVRDVKKGEVEHLLCEECEGILSVYESYAAPIVRRIYDTSSNLGAEVRENVDYQKFKLFQLSILWRAAVATNKWFREVDLGDHKEILRRMLYEENPGSQSDYGCVMTTFSGSGYISRRIQSPEKIIFDGEIETYVFGTPDMTWQFMMPVADKTNPYEELFIREDGLLRVILATKEMEMYEEEKFVRRFRRSALKRYRDK